MDREHVKGAADKAKGSIKETAGKISGDKELQSEGKVDKAEGTEVRRRTQRRARISCAFAHLAKARVIAVLLASLGVLARRLNVPFRKQPLSGSGLLC